MKTKIIVLICAFLFTVSGCAVFRSPLMNAASKGDIETAQKLINNGANLNEKDRYGFTPLIMAITSGKPEAAKTFIQMGADIEGKDQSGFTPLMHAVYLNQYDIAKLLIEKKANVNAKGLSGETPLIFAASNGNALMAKLLIDNGADVNAKNNYNTTALHYASSYEQEKSMSMFKVLIDNGADLSIKDYYGNTPLLYALEHHLIDVVAFLRTKYQDSVDVKSLSSFDNALRAPSRYTPEQGDYLIPEGREKAYANAVSDCSYLVIPFRQSTVMLFPILYPAMLVSDINTIKVEFPKCMEKMGFKCIKDCSK